MKKTLATVVAFLCLAALFVVQYRALQAPGATERLQGLIRDIPAYILYPVVIGFVVLVLIPVLITIFGHKMLAQGEEIRSVRNAQKVALSLWRVDGWPMNKGGGWTVMRFRHLSWSRQYFVLPVRPAHPDIEQFRKLNNGDVVEFEPLQKGMECALEHELCGFLRIKSISSA